MPEPDNMQGRLFATIGIAGMLFLPAIAFLSERLFSRSRLAIELAGVVSGVLVALVFESLAIAKAKRNKRILTVAITVLAILVILMLISYFSFMAAYNARAK